MKTSALLAVVVLAAGTAARLTGLLWLCCVDVLPCGMQSGSWWGGGVQDPGVSRCRGVAMLVRTPVGLGLLLVLVLVLGLGLALARKRAVRHLGGARDVTPFRIAHGSVKRGTGRRATKRHALLCTKVAKPLVTCGISSTESIVDA